MRLSNKLAINLTSEEAQKMKRLCLREMGFMAECLSKARARGCDKTRVISIWLGKRLISWGIIGPVGEPYYRRKKWEANFYTRVRYRNKGYGSRVVSEITKYKKNFRYFSSRKFAKQTWKKDKRTG